MSYNSRKKQEWLKRYKSRQGEAIARRAWEACLEAIKEEIKVRSFEKKIAAMELLEDLENAE